MASPNTCHKHLAEEDTPGVFQNGSAVFRAHHVGWIICGCFTAVATVTSLWLIDKHLQWYTNKREQRYIVRLLFLVPLYALISFASFLFWNNATPLILVRDAYEAIVLTAFFYLLLVYLSPDPEEQRRIFLKRGLSKENDTAARLKGEKLQKWMWPLGFIKKKPKDGLYFLQLMKWGVLQYCVIRPVTALAAVILDYAGYYCEASWSPVWGHLWIVIIISISVTIAMYCLLQLYMSVSKELKPHGVILKLFSVKAVVFLTFWQATLLAALSMVGVVKGTTYMTAEDINIGIGAILQCFEMMIFAFVHIKAFTYKPYRTFHDPRTKDTPPPRTPRLRSLGHALDFRETFREIWVGCVYMYDKMRGREPRHDFSVRRTAHYEQAFGQSRPSQPIRSKAAQPIVEGKGGAKFSPSAADIAVNQEVEVDVAGERQWLGLGDNYGYGLGYFRRERSEGLSVQIEKELQKRGYTPDELPTHHAAQGASGYHPPLGVEKVPSSSRREWSWWKNVYDHIAPSSYRHPKGSTNDSLTPSLPRRLHSKANWTDRQNESAQQSTLLPPDHHDLEDPPSTSALQPEPLTHTPIPPTFHRISPSIDGASMNSDVLAPLSTYQERRRSHYRPKRHKRNTSSQGSAAGLLQGQEPSRYPSPPLEEQSTIDMAELDPRQVDTSLNWPLAHDPSSLLTIPTPAASNANLCSHNYSRSDSLLNRIFPPSEVGSLDGRASTRIETDSAYSLPSIVSGSGEEFGVPGPRPTGDRRMHVHENIYHPTASMNELHVPWTADVMHAHQLDPGVPRERKYVSPKPSSEFGEFGEPPPLPEKDYNYVPSFRRPGVSRKRVASYRSKTRDSAASLPSLPEDGQFAMTPVPPYPHHQFAMRNDTARSSTLVDGDSPPVSPVSMSLRLSTTSAAAGAPTTPAFYRFSQTSDHPGDSRMTPAGGATPTPLGDSDSIVARGAEGSSHRQSSGSKRPARKLLRPPPQRSSTAYISSADGASTSTRPSSVATSSAAPALPPIRLSTADEYPPPHRMRPQAPPPPQYLDTTHLQPPTSSRLSNHRREQARRSTYYDDANDDLSDSVSVNTFYTAASSRPHSAAPPSGPRQP